MATVSAMTLNLRIDHNMSWRHGAQPKAAAPAAKKSSLLALVAASGPAPEAKKVLPPRSSAQLEPEISPVPSQPPPTRPPLAPKLSEVPIPRDPDDEETVSSVHLTESDEEVSHRAKVVTGGDDFDEEFALAVEAMLSTADEGLSREEFEPFDDVVRILTTNDGSDSTVAEIEKRLSKYYDLEEDSSAQVSSYVDRHHSHFNDSIQHFAQMVMSVYDVQESLVTLKRDSSMASMALDSHADELRAAHTTAVRAALSREVLNSIERCSRLVTSIDAYLADGSYLQGARHLRELEGVLRGNTTWEGLGSSSSFRQYCDRVSAQLPTMIVEALLKEVFEIPSSGRTDRVSFRVPSAGLEVLVDGDSDGDGARVVQWMEALRLLECHDFRERLLMGASEGIEKVITNGIQKFMTEARRSRSDPTGVRGHDTSTATTPFLTNRRMAELALLSSSVAALTTLEEATVLTQQSALRGLLVSLCNDVSDVLSLVEYVGRVAAALELPYVERNIFQGSLGASSELWQFFLRVESFDGLQFDEELARMLDGFSQIRLPTRPSVTSFFRELKTISNGVVETKPALSKTVMDQLWVALPERNFVQRHEVGGVSEALSYVREVGEYLASTLQGVPSCVGAILSAAPAALRSTTLTKYRSIVAEWDLSQVYSRAGAHFDILCRALCNIPSGQADVRGPDSSSAKSKRRHKTVPAVKDDFRHLTTQLNTYAAHGPGPRFIEEIGVIGFSLSNAAVTLQRDTRPLIAKMTTKDETSLPNVLQDLANGLLLSMHNAPTVYKVVAEMDVLVKEKGRLLTDSDLWAPLATLEVFLISTYASSLNQQHLAKLRTSFIPFLPTRDSGSVRTVVDVSSRCELLVAVNFCDSVFVKVAQLSAGLPLYVSDEIRRQAAESVVDELILASSRCIESLTQGSFAAAVVFPAFENALKSGSSKMTAAWKVMKNEDDVYGSLVTADNALQKAYAASNAQRTSGYDRRQTVDSDEGAAKLIHAQHSIGALACFCRSFEWLGATFIVRSWGHAGDFEADSVGVGGERLWMPLEDVVALGLTIPEAPTELLSSLQHSLIPGSVFFKGYDILTEKLKDHGHSSLGVTSFAPARRAISLYERILAVSRAALFMLAVDLRCAPLLLLPQLRDESFFVVASSPKADAVVQRLNRHLVAQLAVMGTHLSSLKRKYLALSLARPIAELFLGEMSLLRDRRISEAGQQRLTLDLLHIQSTLLMFAPGDPELGDAVHDYLSRARLFVSHVRNPNVVTDLLASEAYASLKDKDISSLLSLVFQAGQREGVEAIMSLRRRLAALREEVGGGVPQDETPQQLKPSATTLPDAVSPEAPPSASKALDDDDSSSLSDLSKSKGSLKGEGLPSSEDSYSYSYSYTSDASGEDSDASD